MPKINRDIIIPLALIIILAGGFVYVPNIMLYIIISIIISLILHPVQKKLSSFEVQGKHLSKGLASGISLFVFYFLIYSIFAYIFPKMVQQAESLSNLNINQIITSLEEYFYKIQAAYENYVSDGSQSFNDYLKTRIMEIIQIADIPDLVNKLLSLTGDLAIGIFSVTFITFFLLKDGEMIYEFILSLFPSSKQDYYDAVMTEIKMLLNRYFAGLLVEVLLIMTLTSLGLSLIGIPNATLIGFIAGVLNIVYYVGPLMGAIIGLILGLLALYTGQEEVNFLVSMLKILSVFAVVQALDNFVFQPLIYSNSIKAHPLEIFLVILIAGNIWGIIGMVLAIPTYTVVRILIRNFLGTGYRAETKREAENK
ncbi:MAG: AI-2E family transporter [Bacteroidetes bacterium]|nr:MAG: AI-2E family transporter [Bacteroidota bacterium]